MPSTLPWMTVSGVRSSWLTSAIRRRRSFSASASRVLMALNARARVRTSPGPRSGTCDPNSPASTRAEASIRSPIGATVSRAARTSRRMMRATTTRRDVPRTADIHPAPNRVVSIHASAAVRTSRMSTKRGNETRGATSKAAPHGPPGIGALGWERLTLRPPRRSLATAPPRAPAPGRASTLSRQGGTPRRTPSGDSAAIAGRARAFDGCS